ncbi:MAG TPA: ribonuclease R [Gammaproteobacteria bacterium]|nr:ribonuclease R [Gammaproteobacteria bacterium]
MSRRRDTRGREAPRYEVPIPTREEILRALEKAAAPLAFDDVAAALHVTGEAAREGLGRRLAAMLRDGQLVETRAQRYGLAKRMDFIAGRVIGHPDGYAFVRPDSGERDIYIAPRDARRVLHGDRVYVRIAGIDHRDRPFGTVVEVLSRANSEVVGRYFREGGVGFVVPDNRCINQDLLIPAGEEGGAAHGQIVVAAIVQQPDARYQALARVVEVLGDHMAPGMEVDVAIRAHGLPTTWPPGLEDEVARIPSVVTAAEREGRVDLRELPFVTIDGSDARDFDDAVYCKRTRDGFLLYVAIADVAHYVREGTLLDDAARERGTSVYFPDRVIPMLPEALSNGICSLNPDVERLALVCELRLSAAGVALKHRFYNAVIRSHARLIYEDVARWLDAPRAELTPLQGHVLDVYDLYKALRKQREARGALDIDTLEPKFIYNRARKIERIEVRERNDAHKLIEECMIAANVAAAEYLGKHGLPALYRVHDKPDPEKLIALRQFLSELGIRLPGGAAPEARHFAQVLAAAKARPDRQLIETVLLRSLKLAVYRGENAGHFGLGLEAYAHFTSPIRRYPDLFVHRAIKQRLTRRRRPKIAPEALTALAEHTSMTERRADEATREAVAWLKCEYMLDKVGERFAGIVSSVTSFGLFVQLDESFVEGLVHVTALPDDYYQFDAVGHRLFGKRSKREFRVGQRVEVTVLRVNLDERQIDFALNVDGGRKRRR